MKNNFPFNDTSLDLESRVKNLIGNLTLEEKISLIPTQQAAVPRLGIEAYDIGAEGAHGFVDRSGLSTVFPQTIALASTWNRELLFKIGQVIGTEARAYYNKNKHGGTSLWFPTVDMEKDPRWGRTEEGYGEDPFLAGELASEIVRGTQGDDPFYVRATCAPKHFFANNNEKDRVSCSCSVSARNMREYFLEPFRRVFEKGRPFSIMTAYNEVNGIPMIQHPAVGDIVKKQWGLENRGHVVSDGGDVSMTVTAHHYFADHAQTIAASFRAGSDSMTDQPSMVIPAVKSALEQGLISEEELDLHLANIMRVRFRLGHFDSDCPYNSIDESSMMTQESKQLARQAAVQSVVLLKNKCSLKEKKPLLPLDAKNCGHVAVIGPLSDKVYTDWYSGNPSYTVSPLEALERELGDKVIFESGNDEISFSTDNGVPLSLSAAGILEPSEKREASVFVRDDWGWGANTLYSAERKMYLQTVDDLPFDHQPSSEEIEQFKKNGSRGKIVCSAKNTVSWFVSPLFNIIDNEADDGSKCVMIRSWNGKSLGVNGTSLESVQNDSPQNFKMHVVKDGLKAAENAASKADTVLVFCGSNPMINGKEEVDRPSLNLPPRQLELIKRIVSVNPRAAVILVSGYPYAKDSVLEEVPSLLWCGHGMQEEGNALADILLGKESPSGRLPLTWYNSESELHDMMDYDVIVSGMTYRYFEGKPWFAFGHGLSYSEFEYSGFKVSSDRITEQGAEVSVTVKNTGSADAAEVVQLYASSKGGHEWIKVQKLFLAGFERVFLKKGESRTVTFRISSADFAVWDVTRDCFFTQAGTCTLRAGSSSDNLKCTTSLELCGGTIPPRRTDSWVYAWNYDSCYGTRLHERRGSPVPAVFAKSEKERACVTYMDCIFEDCSDTFTAEFCAEGECYAELRDGCESGALIMRVLLPVTGNICSVPGTPERAAWTRMSFKTGNFAGVKNLCLVLEGNCGIQKFKINKGFLCKT